MGFDKPDHNLKQEIKELALQNVSVNWALAGHQAGNYTYEQALEMMVVNLCHTQFGLVNEILRAAQNGIPIPDLPVAGKAVLEYRKVQEEQRRIKTLLESKKFKYGDIVSKKAITNADTIFGIKENEVGKIVGYDEKYDYYRVYFGERMPYQGVREHQLVLWDGYVTSDVRDYDADHIPLIVVNL